MKINDTTGKLAPAAQLERTASGAAGAPGTSGLTPEAGAVTRASTDQVSLSGPARALAVSADAPINMNKVAEIRQKIADGSYRIDAARIADSLLTAARELFARRH